MDQALRTELLAMAEEADRLFGELARTGELYRGYPERMAELNGRHAARLEEMISAAGWPGRSLVGDDGANAAWLIVQHAIAHPHIQRAALAALRQAPDVPPAHAAYLEDKIAFLEGKPQRYGTQFDWDEAGQLSPWTLADPASVDDLRRQVGLNSLAERTAEMRARAAAEGDEPPTKEEWRRRQAEGLEWAERVGWR